MTDLPADMVVDPDAAPEALTSLSPSRVLAYRVLLAGGPFTSDELATAAWLKPRTARKALHDLETIGAVTWDPAPEDERRRVYRAVPPTQLADDPAEVSADA